MLKAMREKPPLVQCITNYVAMNIAANVLLAAGASPAMVHAAEEAGEFAGIASALTINIGTLSTQWVDGMQAAAKAATSAGKPWVLDPVAHYATAFRRNAVAELLALRPTIIRGNASEIIALAGGESRGQESTAAIRSSRRKVRRDGWLSGSGRSLPLPVRWISLPTASGPYASKADRP